MRMQREDIAWQTIWNGTVDLTDRRNNRASKVTSPVSSRKTKPGRVASNKGSSGNKKRAARMNKTRKTWTASVVRLSFKN